ncbi:S-layer homology domain-containing protein [Gorillibacterium massiliense]|uniref:S-layer homology domain-containing protein n=1 Tax=Gorillibacterium massiliense TaxID=1280390 RepID=UPI0004ACBD66|nr:S-layer homology domain-containing protein [Gorillibacterium massiliense]
MIGKKQWRKLKTGVFSLLIAVLLVAASVPGAVGSAKAAEVKGYFTTTSSLDAAGRDEAYRSIVFDMTGWEAGKVISDKPFAVVTQVNTAHKEIKAAVLRVWTGVLSRSEDNLQTYWDEIWLDQDGKVTVSTTDNEELVKDYFTADSSYAFHSAGYLGIVPWGAYIPTDKEAQAAKSGVLDKDQVYNLYGVKFEVPVAEASNQSAVNLDANIPSTIKDVALPQDIFNHWATKYMVTLMQEGIVKGYEDNTIRPNKTLTRAEFITLLVKGMGYTGEESTASYADTGKHWGKHVIGQAIAAGILPVPKAGETFRPDAFITRIDMAVLIDSALKAEGVAPEGIKISFKDISKLKKEQVEALQRVCAAGIITTAEPTGKFRPADTLTRAEAFRVVYGIQDWADKMKGGE